MECCHPLPPPSAGLRTACCLPRDTRRSILSRLRALIVAMSGDDAPARIFQRCFANIAINNHTNSYVANKEERERTRDVAKVPTCRLARSLIPQVIPNQLLFALLLRVVCRQSTTFAQTFESGCHFTRQGQKGRAISRVVKRGSNNKPRVNRPLQTQLRHLSDVSLSRDARRLWTWRDHEGRMRV